MTYMSTTAYSKHRGVSFQRISYLKRHGRLVVLNGQIDKEASDKALDERPPSYRGGEIGGSRSAAAKAQDAEGEVLLTEDEWDTELLREAFARLLAIGIKQSSEETLVDVCNQILREWRGAA